MAPDRKTTRDPKKQDSAVSVAPTPAPTPQPGTPAYYLALQRKMGNQAVSKMIQARLKVGPADDRYEQEADRVASQVVSATANADLKRKPPEEEEVQTQRVQRAAFDHREGFEAGGAVEAQLNSQRGGGSKLAPDVQSRMESGFGVGFDNVRVHTDGAAANLNRSLHAEAFTHGSDVYFSPGTYSPGTSAGDHLLAHELTHVVQQTGGVKRKVSQIQRRGKGELSNLASVTGKNYVNASTSGTIGVFFLTERRSDDVAGPGASIVVKFEPEDASSAVFAEEFLGEMGISTPGSQMTPMSSKHGKAVYNKVSSLVTGGAYAPARKVAVEQKLAAAAGASTVVVSDFVEGATMGDMMYTQGAANAGNMSRADVADALMDSTVAIDIGRIAIFDMFLGNEDRIMASKGDRINANNIMLVPRGGRRWKAIAIDNATDAPSLKGMADQRMITKGQELILDFGQVGKAEATADPTQLVDKLLGGGNNTLGVMSAPLNIINEGLDVLAARTSSGVMAYFDKTVKAAADPADVAIWNSINWRYFANFLKLGMDNALKQLAGVTQKQLKTVYDSVKGQTGKMSNEVDLFTMQLKLHYINGVLAGEEPDALRTEMIAMARKKFGKSEKSKGTFTQEMGKLSPTWVK